MARILVVDDHPDVTGILRQIFCAAGHDVVCCENGELALEEMTRLAPQIMITDQRLPGITGVELVRAVGALDSLDRVWKIVWSADDTVAELAMAAGAQEFWVKGSDSVFDRIDALVEQLRGT